MTRRLATLALALLGPSAGASDWFQHRWEMDAEYTWTGTGESLFNPGGSLYAVEEWRGLMRGHADLSARAGSRVAFKTRLAGEYVDAVEAGGEAAVRELYVHGSFGPVDVSAGRKILRWSGGYAFNPAGVLDPPRDPADPQDRLGSLRGRDMVQVDVFGGSQTLTLAAASDGVFEGPFDAGAIVALRYELRVGALNAALIAGLRPRGREVGALSFSLGAGDRLALHGEASVTRGSDALLPRSALPGGDTTLYGPDFWAPLRTDDDRLVLRYLAGLNYTLPGGINLIAEYYHSDEGLSRDEWDRFLGQARLSRSLAEAGAPPVSEGRSLPELNLLQGLQGLGRPGLGRDYLFLRLAPPRIGRRLELTALGLANLRDGSFLVVPELGWSAGRRVVVYFRSTLFSGDGGSEYGNVPVSGAASLGARVFF